MKPQSPPSAPSAPASKRILKLPQVEEVTGLRRDSIYRLAREGKFPRPIKLSEKSSGWIEHEVQAFLDERIAERDAAPGV